MIDAYNRDARWVIWFMILFVVFFLLVSARGRGTPSAPVNET